MIFVTKYLKENTNTSAQNCTLSLRLMASESSAGFSSETSAVRTFGGLVFCCLPFPNRVCPVGARERQSVEGQQLVTSVPLEDEINERVVRRGALSKEAG